MNILNDYIRIEEKSVFSHKVYNIVGISAVSVAAVMELLCLILYLTVPSLGLYVYTILFYPIAILLIVAFFFTVPELIRNTYALSLITVVAATLLSLLLVTSIFLQGFLLGHVYIIPFYFL
ncbi:MAG: hypothetical protein HFE48_03320 [Clostridia bacterium]|nr:hypothetical protein [Clostridia bacterium]